MTVASGSITNSNPDTSSEMYNVDLEIPVPENLRISPDINKSGSDNLSLSPEVTLLGVLPTPQLVDARALGLSIEASHSTL